MSKIELSVIPELKEKEILVARVDIGNLPAAKAKDYLAAVGAEIEKHVKDNHILVMANNSHLEVLPELTETSVVIATVDVGTLPAEKADEYMQSLTKWLQRNVAPAKVQVVPKQVELRVEA